MYSFLYTIRTLQKNEEVGGTTHRQQQQLKIRPLYDIPYMWEAREFLRKKLIGKKVMCVPTWRLRINFKPPTCAGGYVAIRLVKMCMQKQPFSAIVM